jgi:hypothetical protein
MPKKKGPPLSAQEQKRRFEALARQLGAQKSDTEFKEALRGMRLRKAKRPAAKQK